MPRPGFIVLVRSAVLWLGLLLLAPASHAIEIELGGAGLPAGPFTLFAAPGELLVLTLPNGTDNTQLYLDGVGVGQRKSKNVPPHEVKRFHNRQPTFTFIYTDLLQLHCWDDTLPPFPPSAAR